MNVVNAKELLGYVAKAASVVDSGALIPIIKNILFKGYGASAKLYATDLGTSIEVDVPNFNLLEGLSYAVETKKLVDLLKSLGDTDIEMRFGDTFVEIKSNKGKYKIATLPGADFPELDVIKGDLSAKGYIFERAIGLTIGAVSNDDLRPSMTGIYFDTIEGYVASTNGHKLSRYEYKFEGEPFIIPTKSLSLFNGLGDADVYYHQADNHAHFVTNGIAFKVRLIDGKYPPYNKVIPTGNDKTLLVDGKSLLSSLKRINLFSSSETNSVLFDIQGGTLQITGQDVNYGNSGKEVLEAEYTGEDIKIGFNAKYLIDLLNVAGDGKIKITFSEPQKPVLLWSLSNPKHLQLVMPVMI